MKSSQVYIYIYIFFLNEIKPSIYIYILNEIKPSISFLMKIINKISTFLILQFTISENKTEAVLQHKYSFFIN